MLFRSVLLLLLALPEALGGSGEVEVPVSAALLAPPCYLLSLLLCSAHVLLCTSAQASCYSCSLPWGLVFPALAFSSALLCILLSMATRRLPLGAKPPGKVSFFPSFYQAPSPGGSLSGEGGQAE